jgi:hypothetical protein
MKNGKDHGTQGKILKRKEKQYTVETRNNLHATVVRLQLILFSKDIGAF